MAFPSTGILLDPAGLGNAGPPPSGSFTTSVGAGLKIASGKIAPNATNDYQGAAWTSPFSADMEAHVRIATLPTVDATITLGCIVRLQTAGNANSDHYEICVNRQTGANDKLELYRIASSGTYTFLVGYTLGGEIQLNDQVGLAAYGSLIVGFYNGSAVMTARDTVVASGGCAALTYYINGMGEFGAFGGGNVSRKLRLYLPSSGAPGISPSFDAAWGDTEDADRIAAVSSPSNTAMTDKTCDEAVSTNPLNVLARQYIYGPLTAGWKIEGVVRGVIRCLESNAAADFMAALKIRGVDSAGANPSTVLDISTAALSNELGTSAASRFFPRNWSSVILTPWTVPAGGGYLVIEVGVRSVNTSTTNRTATFRFGDSTSNSDRTEDETATNDNRPWIEFSDVGAVSSVADRDGSAAGAATATGLSGVIHGRDGTAAGTGAATGHSAAIQGRVGSASGAAAATGQSADANLLENAKIAAPASGIYFGQYSWAPDGQDIPTVEAAAGIRTSHYSALSGNWGSGAMSYASGHPSFDAAVADAVWAQGRVVVAQAYNLYAGTDDEHPSGFTIDLLLAGTYDTQLSAFAAQLRAFGKPLWFQCGREPNGVGQDFMGGFGANGDQSLSWAITNESAYNLFVPPAPPSGAPADLYSGCSGATMPDGIGRLKAGQRYIYDFMVRRENLHFLTFDSQGFNVRYHKDGTDNQDQYDSADYTGHEAYALTLLQRCSDPANWYPGDRWCDWVSLTWYMLDYYDASWSWLSGSDILLSNADWIASLDFMMDALAGVTSKPVLLAECGFPDGTDSDTVYGASKVTDGFNAILDDYPQIGAVSMWSELLPADGGWFAADNFPYQCLIKPGTTQATALQAVIAAHPGAFHSYIQLTNGDTLTDGLAERDGTTAGTGTATGQIAATQGRQGTAAGAATPNGQAADLESRQGSATGQASATGVAADLETRAGTATGSGSAAGVAGDIEARTGSTSGQGTAAGQTAATQNRTGSAAGVGVAIGLAADLEPRQGTATGQSTDTGAAADLETRTGTITGMGSASGAAADLEARAGSTAGVAGVTGAGEDAATGQADGTSAGVALAQGQSAQTQGRAGSATGAGAATGQTGDLESRQGSAVGQAADNGAAADIEARHGTAIGTGSGSGAAARTAAVDGTSQAQASVLGEPLIPATVLRLVEVEVMLSPSIDVDALLATLRDETAHVNDKSDVDVFVLT